MWIYSCGFSSRRDTTRVFDRLVSSPWVLNPGAIHYPIESVGLESLTIENQGHRAVIDELHLHVRTEHTGLHVQATLTQRLNVIVEQRLTHRTGRGGPSSHPRTG